MSKYSRKYQKLYGNKVLFTQKDNSKDAQTKTQFKLSEEQVKLFTLLPDNYPVYWDYIYLVDGVPIRSDIQGTIITLKHNLRLLGKEAKEIRAFDFSLYQSFLN